MAFTLALTGITTGDRYRVISEARMIAALVLAGWVYEQGPAAEEGCRQALDRWVAMGLGFRRGPDGDRLFDQVEVEHFMKEAFLQGRDNFWIERHLPTGRRLVADLAAGGEEQSFTVELKRSFHVAGLAPGTRLRLRMPLPIEGSGLRNLQVVPWPDNPPRSQVTVRPGRLEMQGLVSGEAEIAFGAKVSFLARPGRYGAGEAAPDRALYLHPREGMIAVSERISALARSLAGAGMPSLEAIRAFWDCIHDRFKSGGLHYDQVDLASPCDWLLDGGWLDCRSASALLVALCRAHGIPARLVGGYLLYRPAPTNHYWVEAWIEGQGWTPFDFFSWDLSAGGRDRDWRDRFFGHIDHRMITERLPRQFTGAVGVPIPETWSILQRVREGGVEINFLGENGAPVYADTVRVLS